MIKSYQFSDPIASNYGKLYDIAIKNFNKPINEKTMPFSFGGDDKSHGNPIGIFRQGLCFNDKYCSGTQKGSNKYKHYTE